MPPVERDAPADARQVRHQHSVSIDGRALVPMWDSSDPERAPPPLPLNPQSPTVTTSRAGTSAAIQSAHAALTEKARESALVPTLAKRMSQDVSPERSLVARGSPHKRMQSLQPSSVRDLSLMIEGSPRRDSSPEKFSRPSTPNRMREDGEGSVEKDCYTSNSSPMPMPMPITLNPAARPSMRRAPQSILGENTPPQSATMRALQNMPSVLTREGGPRDSQVFGTPLANVTNNSTALVRSNPSMDHLSGQIITLTNIATALQKEMSLLSRRSRDNATDLMSLKEATHARDEDIRKSLRELASNVDGPKNSRDQFGGGLFLENKPHGSPPTSKAMRPFSLPRIPSPTSFSASIDRETNLSTPSLIGGDSPATIALLEKIIRDMGTKDGQDTVIVRLSELAERLAGMASSVKVEELIHQLRSTSQELSLVPAGGGRGGGGGGSNRPRNFNFDEDDDGNLPELDWNDTSGPVSQRLDALVHDESRRPSAPPSRPNEVLNEDVIKVIRGVKDSVAQGGGLTAEVKALVRELRGEVLGMGREIGRRLDEVNVKTAKTGEPATEAQIERIVEEGLAQMTAHLDDILREHRRSSAESTKSVVDYQEIYNAMRAALNDSQKKKSDEPDLSRGDVMQAVKEAWENYKPEIQVEQIGLERDEVLACLQEGFHQYASRHEEPQGATREEVFKAVVEGLKHFKPPQVDTPASLSRDEILEAVRECLEEFEFPVAPSANNNDFTREDMLEAVKRGIESADLPNQNAVLAQSGSVENTDILARLHDIMQFVQDEFRAVSEEAKQNVAANGRDTEQVLDATKDGFEQLRTQMESYIERVKSASSQEELIESLVRSVDGFRDELSDLVVKASDGSKIMLKEEIEKLRDTVNSSLVPHTPPAADNREALEALQEGLERVRMELLRPRAGTTDILDALSEGFGDLRLSVEKMSNQPVDLTANDEILDALKSGLDGVRTDIDSLREHSQNDKAIAPVGATATDVIIPADILRQNDIKNLEVMLTQLRIKLEAIDIPAPTQDSLSKHDLAEMEEMLRNLQDSVTGMAGRDADKPTNLEDASTKEDVLAIETILRNTKARLDDMIEGEQAVRKNHIDAIEALVLETKDSLGLLAVQLESVSRKDDVLSVESLVTQVTASFDEMKERAEKSLEDPERVTKTDVDAVEAVCLDMKSVIEQMLKSDIATLASKEDMKSVEDVVREAKTALDAQADTNAKAFEERQAEIVGVSESVTEVKSFLEEFQGMVKGKLENDTTGLEALGKLLESLGETLGQSTVSQDLKEMFETMKTEFEESKAGVVGAKLDNDDKLQSTADILGSKIDEKIGELVTKYDEFQLVMEDRTKTGEARDVELEAAVVGTKAVADELKLLIDTLGSTVTESMEKMEEASKTVFERVEDLVSKSEETHSDDKNEHAATRDQVKTAVTVVEGLKGHVVEYQPKILEAVKDVLLIVGQHYEHSKTSTADALSDLRQQIEVVKEKEPELPLLPPVEKYDDTEMHEKLDKLVDHTHAAGKAYAQLDTLDKVHTQVVQTAADISNFLEAQTKQIEEKREDDAKTLEETKMALAVAKAEKEHVEANVVALRLEEDELRERILALRTEQEFLTRQRTRLTADVSSMETAMRIRREELQAMETRAEGLERRILEGVLDHSRALLITKAGSKGRDAMSRKRVSTARSGLSPADASSLNSQPTAPHQKAVNIAISGNRASLIPPNPAGASRRILSLSQITNNVSIGGIKRSQSVRAANGAGPLRKSSWGGGLGKKYGELSDDKENGPIDAVRELEESLDSEAEPTPEPESLGNGDDGELENEEEASDTGTLRRSSLGTTVITGMETEGGYSDDYEGESYDGQSEFTESAVGTETALGTGSTADTDSIADSGLGEGGEVVVYGAYE